MSNYKQKEDQYNVDSKRKIWSFLIIWLCFSTMLLLVFFAVSVKNS